MSYVVNTPAAMPMPGWATGSTSAGPAANSAAPAASQNASANSTVTASAASVTLAAPSHVGVPAADIPSFALSSAVAPEPVASSIVQAASQVGLSAGASLLFGSVFSSESGSGSPDGPQLSALPFMSDGSWEDVPVYLASSETPWLLMADFGGDDWFFV